MSVVPRRFHWFAVICLALLGGTLAAEEPTPG